MVSKDSIIVVLDKAAIRYQQCWRILRKIKQADDKEDFAKNILEFQPVLCKALLKLEKVYQTIAQEKEYFIQKKSKLSASWFNQRMKTLSGYQKAIEKCIYLGKALGDSFAWIFYEDERPLLDEHLKHEELSHLPSGIGAVGELAFIKNVKSMGNCLIIYHGITTFLRLGDVSLFDFSSQKVTAIGELKTRQVDKKHVEVTIILAGWQPQRNEQSNLVSGENSIPGKSSLLIDLPPKMKERLGRQLKNISVSLDKRNKKPDNQKSMSVQIHINELNQLYTKLKPYRFEYQKVGPGLLLMAYRNRPQPLSSRLLGRSQANSNKKLKEFPNKVHSIIDQTRNDNSLYHSSFYYDSSGRAFGLKGTTPLLWWPLNINLIRAIIFQDIFIITIFNPVHLIKKLESIGWKVEQNAENGTYLVTKENNGTELRIEYFSYFMKLIQNYLFREEVIVNVIGDTAKTVDQEGLPPYTRVVMNIQQFFRREPNITD